MQLHDRPFLGVGNAVSDDVLASVPSKTPSVPRRELRVTNLLAQAAIHADSHEHRKRRYDTLHSWRVHLSRLIRPLDQIHATRLRGFDVKWWLFSQRKWRWSTHGATQTQYPTFGNTRGSVVFTHKARIRRHFHLTTAQNKARQMDPETWIWLFQEYSKCYSKSMPFRGHTVKDSKFGPVVCFTVNAAYFQDFYLHDFPS
jgi:hypothetical protein